MSLKADCSHNNINNHNILHYKHKTSLFKHQHKMLALYRWSINRVTETDSMYSHNHNISLALICSKKYTVLKVIYKFVIKS